MQIPNLQLRGMQLDVTIMLVEDMISHTNISGDLPDLIVAVPMDGLRLVVHLQLV